MALLHICHQNNGRGKKILTCVRVGHKQKPIEIDIPSLNKFIHRVYINVARRLYSNVYLFEKNILPLQIQKHNREIEMIIKECILNSDEYTIKGIVHSIMYIQKTPPSFSERIKGFLIFRLPDCIFVSALPQKSEAD